MSEDDRSEYLSFFDKLIARRALKSIPEEMLARRMFALLEGSVMPAYSLRDDWEGFLRHHEAFYGPKPRLASLGYGWLGEQLSMTKSPRGFFAARRPQLRDANGAVEMLRRSIELDPDNLAAHLALCTVYDALKQTSERNRLLDAMTARFPDDKKVLLRAGQGCIERKAFVKGLDYLSRARQLDPLDPQIPTFMVTAQRRLARQHFQQRRPDKGRQILAQTEALLLDKADDFQRSRWTALVRHGLMEKLWGDADQGEALLAQARTSAPRPEACLLFAHMTHRVYLNLRQCESPFLAEFRQTLRSASSIGGMGLLLKILDYWKGAPETPQVYEEERTLRDSFKAALRQPFTRAEAVDVIERIQGNFALEEQVEALVKKVLRDDPLDPRFRLYQLDLSGPLGVSPSRNRAELQSILEEAIRRQDDATVRRAREMLRELDHPPGPGPLPFDPDFFADPEDEPEELEDDFDETMDADGLLPPDLSPAQTAQFSEMLEILRTAPDSLIRKMRKTRPPDMPEFLFDALVTLAKSGSPPPLPPLPSPPKPPAPRPEASKPVPAPQPPKPAPPPEDPSQLKLF